MADLRNNRMAVPNVAPLGNRSTQRRLTLAMVGNVIMMVILVFALTFGGFLYMDYKTAEAKAKKMDKRVGELRRQFEEDCRKD